MWSGLSATETITGPTDLVPGSPGIASGLVEPQLQVAVSLCRWGVGGELNLGLLE